MVAIPLEIPMLLFACSGVAGSVACLLYAREQAQARARRASRQAAREPATRAVEVPAVRPERTTEPGAPAFARAEAEGMAFFSQPTREVPVLARTEAVTRPVPVLRRHRQR
jgi:hypothetical protein